MKNEKDVLLMIIGIAVIFYGVYLHYQYEITTYDFFIYIVISYAIFIIWIWKSKPLEAKSHNLIKNNKREANKTAQKLGMVKYIILMLVAPMLISFLIRPMISFHYTLLFGEEITYTAMVYDKHTSSSRRKTSYYITISSELEKEEIKCKTLYEKVNMGAKLRITKKHSTLGSYIKYSEIKILSNRF